MRYLPLLFLVACGEPMAPRLEDACPRPGDPPAATHALIMSRTDSTGTEVERRLIACLTREQLDGFFPPTH